MIPPALFCCQLINIALQGLRNIDVPGYSLAVVNSYKQGSAKKSQLDQALPNHWPRDPVIGRIILSSLVGPAGPLVLEMIWQLP